MQNFKIQQEKVSSRRNHKESITSDNMDMSGADLHSCSVDKSGYYMGDCHDSNESTSCRKEVLYQNFNESKEISANVAICTVSATNEDLTCDITCKTPIKVDQECDTEKCSDTKDAVIQKAILILLIYYISLQMMNQKYKAMNQKYQ